MTYDRLEIIDSSGKIEFYDLNSAKGLVNIGRHAENDIIIDDRRVAPFQAMLDYRRKPYQFIVLSQENQTRLGGELLPPNESVPLQNLDTIEVGGATLVLLINQNSLQTVNQGPSSLPPTPTRSLPVYEPPPAPPPVSPAPSAPDTSPVEPATPAPIHPPATRPEAFTAPAAPPPSPSPPPPSPSPASSPRTNGLFQALPPEKRDEIIITEFFDDQITVDVDHTAMFEVTIINGGPLVASFAVAVQGLDDQWVTVSEPYVNLYEGGRATVTVSVTPPRLSSSRAGVHYFAIVVTSADYPGHYSQHGAALVVTPYHDFSISELSPKQQTISWFKRSARTMLTVANKGNGEASFRIEGADNERACSFELQAPGGQVAQAAQAEFGLAPEQAASIPATIIPHSRPLFLRKRVHRFNLTVTALEGQHSPRALPGELSQRPLFGLLSLLLLAILLFFLCSFIFWPYIYIFTVNDQVNPVTIQSGQEASLAWSVSPFAALRINPDIGRREEKEGRLTVSPGDTTLYELETTNLLSVLFPFLGQIFGDTKREVTLFVDPVKPIIHDFEATPETIFTGQEVTLIWNVSRAEELILTANGAPETLADPIGQRNHLPEEDTTYVLIARNSDGETQANLSVDVSEPPLPTPFIKKFIVEPERIVQGESVRIEWEIEGADRIDIQGIGSNLPPEQILTQSPSETINYILNAFNGPVQAPPLARPVAVNTPIPTVTPTPLPSATPEPETPVIVFFTAEPAEVIRGESAEIELQWEVDGLTTNIELSSPELSSPLANLATEGSFKMSVSDAAIFVLTAFNDTAKVSASAQVEAIDPTPIPPPPPTPVPPAEIVDFSIVSPGPPKVVKQGMEFYQVQKDTKVVFQWETNDAANSVTFRAPNGEAETGAVPIGQTEKTIVRGNYTLVAENSEGKKTSPQVIQVEVVGRPPPDPPFSLVGVEKPGEKKNEIEWKWTADPDKSDLAAFRVYRATTPGGSFRSIADLPSDQMSYEDAVEEETCGKVYYVVALYEDITGATRESAASLNSWPSLPCPPD